MIDQYFSYGELLDDQRSNGVNLGVSTKVEASWDSWLLPFSIKASVEGSYNRSGLSTHSVQTQESTTIHFHFNTIDNQYSYSVMPYLYWSKDGYLVFDYVANTKDTAFWQRYDKPDPAFLLPWYDGSCGAHKIEYSKEIVIDPPHANVGDKVTITSTVRNFSNIGAYDVMVGFYQGDPDHGGKLIETSGISEIKPRDQVQISIEWQAEGSGEQRIYAVIDPEDDLVEMHDENDPYVNNNKAYSILTIGSLEYIDPGLASSLAYVPMKLSSGGSAVNTQAAGTSGGNAETGLDISFFVPPGNFEEITLFDLKSVDIQGLLAAGAPFQLSSYQDGEPVPDFDLVPADGSPPSAITIEYNDAEVAGRDESNLRLYRLSGYYTWEDATCGGYRIMRFMEENRIIVPVCQTGTFALSDGEPEYQLLIYLPLTLKTK